MSGHTPGPWRGRRSSDKHWTEVDAPGWASFMRIATRMTGATADKPEALANVKLILSAPDMRAALEQIAALCDDEALSGFDRLDAIDKIACQFRPVKMWRISDDEGNWWGGTGWFDDVKYAEVYPLDIVDHRLPIDGTWEPVYD